MTDYMFTAWSNGLGWRDIAVTNADNMNAAIALAERTSGCLVSHGRGHIGAEFDPSLTVDAATGEVVEHHQRTTKPLVNTGPPDVVRAIQLALAPARKTRAS